MILLVIVEGEGMDQMQNKRVGFNLKEITIVIIITAIVTSLTTGVIVYNQNKLTKNVTYQDLNQDTALREFLEVYASLIDEYYESVDKKAMLENAISAMFNYLGEDYSTYMSKEETDSLAEKLMGEYKGIGITIDKENKIVEFIEGSPAKEAGLQIGDKIISVNGTVITETNQITEIIGKANSGDTLKITVTRNAETLTYEVKSKQLYIPAINYKMTEGNVGYLRISTFSNTLGDQVKLALQSLESQNMTSLVIDLRDNTGGYLSAAKDVANLFLEKGKLIYSLEEKENTKQYKDETDEHREYKIVVLLNDNSASASEVLIAALKESYGATTVGTTSYGKGKVQQTHTLEDGSMVKYTSAKWLTPNGTCIDEIGITPDYMVIDSFDTPDMDEQLEKALELAK